MSTLVPAASSYHAASMPLSNRAARALWALAYGLLVHPTPRPMHAWRAWVLRRFGAQIGPDCHIYAKARIWAPWNLICEEGACIADGAVVYNPATVRLGAYCVVSQDAYLCGATHDFEDPSFPMVSRPITIGPRAWICARAVVGAGVTVGEGAVLGLASVSVKDLEAWSVYAGMPARRLRERVMR